MRAMIGASAQTLRPPSSASVMLPITSLPMKSGAKPSSARNATKYRL